MERWSDIDYKLIRKCDHVGACDFRTPLIGYVVVVNRSQHLRLCPTNLLDGFIRVTVDDGGQSGVRRFETLKSARSGKFFLPLFGPAVDQTSDFLDELSYQLA
jgi:hypothetical protein